MEKEFNIQEYMTKGVEQVVSDALRATFKDPRESAYIVKFAAASKKASKKRAKAEKEGEHIPPFLIASITSACNLHCAGCYSRCNNATVDAEPCPFSPYSDINVRDTSVREALKSRLFNALQTGGVLADDHKGGCVLFEKREQVEDLLAAE